MTDNEDDLDTVETTDQDRGGVAFALMLLFLLSMCIVTKIFDLLENLAQPSFLVTDCAASCTPNHMSKSTPYSCICALE